MLSCLRVRRFVVKNDWSSHGLDEEFSCKLTAGMNGEKGIKKG